MNEIREKAIDWWRFQSEDEQIWILMQLGILPRDPKRLSWSQIEEIYILKKDEKN